MPELSISIISHRQIQLVQLLLTDIQQHCTGVSLEVILTMNVEELLPFDASDYIIPIQVIRNIAPKGFGENHNAAFQLSAGAFFCILNPDIRFSVDPFLALIVEAQKEGVGLVAPLVTNNEGVQEDSVRQFPSPVEIIGKVCGGRSVVHYDELQRISHPDWVAGMFMLFPRMVFQRIGGFDERYFLYYEDVDLCARLTLANYKIVYCSTVHVVHNAQRSSHKSVRYMRMHLISMLRFFSSSIYRKLRRRVVK